MLALRNVGRIENLEREILSTIHYFSFFDYPPTFEEIYTFLKKKLSKQHLARILEKMEKKKLIKVYRKQNRYTLGEYDKKIKDKRLKIKDWRKREGHSRKKIQKIQLFLKILSLFPQIILVGLSGSVTMMNADEKDDIDLFMISAKNRMWTARIISFIISQLMGLRRKAGQKEAKNKICLNLFFDEANLKVPKYKQTEYVAHEVLQMKPVIQKGDIYMNFIDANRWVFDIFPNAELNSKLQTLNSKQIQNSKNQNSKRFGFMILDLFRISDLGFRVSNKIEYLLKCLQLYSIRKHQTTEIITDTQLWFFPEDFEKKLNIK